MELINNALNQAAGAFKSTFGDVGEELRDGFKDVQSAFGDSFAILKASGATIGQRLAASFSAFYDEHPFIVLGTGAALVLTAGVWSPALIRTAARLPKVALHLVKTPLVLLGFAR